AAAVLLQITTVVAWLQQTGIERAFSLVQLREEEKDQLYSELEKSSRLEALGKLAGGIAHDFNNFLVVIQGSAELAAESLSDRPEVLDEVRQIEDAAGRAAALTAQLLAFSRRQLVPPMRVKLRDVLEELRPILDRLIGSRLTLKCDLSATDAEVIASP